MGDLYRYPPETNLIMASSSAWRCMWHFYVNIAVSTEQNVYRKSPHGESFQYYW